MKYIIHKLTHTFLTLACLFLVSSCDEDAMFKKEMYKQVFAIVSSDSYNVFAEEVDLGDAQPGYISVSLGGTTTADKDIYISFIEDIDLFNRYNKGTYDIESSKYAKLLPPSHYRIDDYHLTIPAGERNGRMEIRIDPAGLSPDSTYLVSLKIDDFTNYEVNPDKSDVLYRVDLKNYWAAQKTATNYTIKGNLDGGNVFGVKRVQPLSWNSVRTMAGNITFEADTAIINPNSIILETGDDGYVSIKPYKDIEIEQIDTDPDYPNKFFIDDDGFRTFKSFLLHYQYRLAGTDAYHEMREELRLEFKEENK
ncbi:hypothetical protein EZS27_012735 [termite gut metagenome]|uniref:DUF1735 domain-containing protein n=1 Tax=termite gut metagenome TaxID=433724 RepID=A0A5J4S0H3_9ZZZZ